jgi:glycosyltransferase involved in cell wall biosynthesis
MEKSKKKAKVLFISDSGRTFIQRDLKILEKHFDVIKIKWTRSRDIINLLRIMKGVIKTDVSYIWFGHIQAVLPIIFSKIFRKKTVVVAGGIDAANEPWMKFGQMCHPFQKYIGKFVFNFADKIFAVSKSTEKELLKNVNPNLKNIKIIYNALDYKLYSYGRNKEDIILTIGEVKKDNLKRKGLETFVRSSLFLPDYKFALVGRCDNEIADYLRKISSKNVSFAGYVSFEKLKARVYVQVSGHEAFGCSLAEAMLCGCVPVATKKAALPEVVGDTGFYVPYGNPKTTAKAIKKALKSDKGKLARKRIIEKFSLAKREEKIVFEIKKLLGR